MNTIESKVKERYKELSQGNSFLSCGNSLGFLELQAGENLLDLGCGAGGEALTAARLVGPTGRVFGLDLTPEMVQRATENASAAGLANIGFIVGDMEQLLFEGCLFHAVISNCAINHARNKKKVFQEIYRVLKPNGQMVISDAVTREPLPAQIKNDPDQWAACFGGAVTEWEYLQGIRQAGFQSIEILKRREYVKNGYDFISLTIRATKPEA